MQPPMADDQGRQAHSGSGGSTPVGVIKTTGWAGLASFTLIMLAAFVLAPPIWQAPDTKAAALQVVAYAHREAGASIASLFVYSIALGFFICFAAGLWVWLSQESGSPHLSATFAFAALALVVLILAAFASGAVLSYRPQQPAIAQMLRDMTFGLLAISGIPTAVCMTAFAMLVVKRRILPLWTALLALVGACAHLLIAASFVSHGKILSVEGAVIVLVPGTLFAWIFATSVALLRTDAHGEPAGGLA